MSWEQKAIRVRNMLPPFGEIMVIAEKDEYWQVRKVAVLRIAELREQNRHDKELPKFVDDFLAKIAATDEENLVRIAAVESISSKSSLDSLTHDSNEDIRDIARMKLANL